MKFQYSFPVRLFTKQCIFRPLPAMFIMFLTVIQLWPPGVAAQAKDTTAHSPYTLPVPAGWTTEEFPLPPDFAPSFTWKGMEDIRFHSGWGDSTNEGYWSYAYLWWLDGMVDVNAPALKHNLEAYYTGLVGSNIERRKIPAGALVTTVAVIKKAKTINGDKETFTGTIRMLDYMRQRPMVLNCIVHVKKPGSKDKSAVLVEVSPQASGHLVWKQLDSVAEGFLISTHH